MRSAPALLCAALAACGTPDRGETPAGPGPSADAGAAEALLDGRERTFVVIGYSSSLRWPEILQEALDAHAGGPGLYHVANAAVGGATLPRWLGADAQPRGRDPFERMERRWFEPGVERGDRPRPTVALCQMSLQEVFGPREEGVRGPGDSERIEAGADAFAALGERLRALGIERVLLSTHIYKHGQEPIIGNERLALAALLARGDPPVVPGPELWSATREVYPAGFQRDGRHPGEAASRIMAAGWYVTLAGSAADAAITRALLGDG